MLKSTASLHCLRASPVDGLLLLVVCWWLARGTLLLSSSSLRVYVKSDVNLLSFPSFLVFCFTQTSFVVYEISNLLILISLVFFSASLVSVISQKHHLAAAFVHLSSSCEATVKACLHCSLHCVSTQFATVCFCTLASQSSFVLHHLGCCLLLLPP